MVRKEFILASNSPRRRELLGLTGSKFQVIPAEVDEDTRQGESASEYVLRLAESKARVVGNHQNNGFIIAADTTVVDDGQILGKPIDEKDAHRMLTQLRGRTHKVYTALAVMDTADGSLSTDLCLTEVPMRQYSDAEIKSYIDSGDPLDKAGAYAIQHSGFHPVENLTGCYANVVGLPLCHLARTLRRFKINMDLDFTAICRTNLRYKCSVFNSILQETI